MWIKLLNVNYDTVKYINVDTITSVDINNLLNEEYYETTLTLTSGECITYYPNIKPYNIKDEELNKNLKIDSSILLPSRDKHIYKDLLRININIETKVGNHFINTLFSPYKGY